MISKTSPVALALTEIAHKIISSGNLDLQALSGLLIGCLYHVNSNSSFRHSRLESHTLPCKHVKNYPTLAHMQNCRLYSHYDPTTLHSFPAAKQAIRPNLPSVSLIREASPRTLPLWFCELGL